MSRGLSESLSQKLRVKFAILLREEYPAAGEKC